MRIHIVGRGETLLAIAKKTGLSPAWLAAENGLMPTAPLTEGQSLLYTRPAKLLAVRYGEKAGELCRAEHLSLRQLLRLNPQLEADARLPSGQEVAVVPSAVPFGQMSVFGLLSPKASEEECAASLPYLTCLVCGGCRFTESGIRIPPVVRRLRMRYPALLPSLWAAADAEGFLCLLRRGDMKKLPAMLREAGFAGVCLVVRTDKTLPVGFAVPPEVSKRPQTNETGESGTRKTADGDVREEILLLHKILTDAGMGLCALSAGRTAEEYDTFSFPHLRCGNESECISGFCRRIDTSEQGGRRMSWPRIPDTGTCLSVRPDGTKQKETIDLRQIPALLSRCRPTVRREEEGAFFSYRTRAGRQAVRHDLHFEDAFSLSEGLYAMNRLGLCGVWCDAARVPVWMLYMLSACYEIVDPPTAG